jgi:hypothetical protein
LTSVTDHPTGIEDPALAPDVAVFDGAGWCFPGGRRRSMPRTLEELGQLSIAYGLRQLFVLPSAMPALGLPHGPGPWYRLRPGSSYPDPFVNSPGPWHVGTTGGGLRAGFTCWVPGTDHAFEVTLLEWEPPNRTGGPRGGPWGDCGTGEELLEQLARWHRATGGAVWRRTGAITSEAWLRDHYRRAGTLRATETPEGLENVEADLTWHRAPFALVEAKAAHCHAFDLNAMYLSAASSLALPVGTPEHRSGRWVDKPAATEPGYWRLDRGWVTSPTLALLREQLGPDLKVLEGWCYPEHHRFLEPWYRTWRDARAELLAGGGPALEAVKATYRQGVGRMGSTRRARGDADPLHQPYWRQAVIAEARTRLERRIAKLRQGPVAVDVDCLWFLTNTADPTRFAHRTGLPVGDGLGQFHLRSSCTGRAARSALEDPDHHSSIDKLRGL